MKMIMEKEWVASDLSEKIVDWIRPNHHDFINLQNGWQLGQYKHPHKSYTGFDLFFEKKPDDVWKQRLDLNIYSGGDSSVLGAIISVVAREQKETGLVESLCQKQVFDSAVFDAFVTIVNPPVVSP